MTLLEKLSRPGPKRILALDGGGIRGALTLGFLKKIEAILRSRHGNPDLKLCDYFDLIGGTSTGAIIAAALAIGKTAKELAEMYQELGGEVFGKKKIKIWEARFSEKPLHEQLQKVFEDRTLGDPGIKTGLCVVTKRADTSSTWPLINHPGGTYYELNKDILLREAVRASTAAPVYFRPQMLHVGAGEEGAFVDGGVSMANNPAMQLFLVATLQGFPFRWTPGGDQLLLVSVGTGIWSKKDTVKDVMGDNLLELAAQVPGMLMEDANWYNQLLLQYMSKTATPWKIDGEIGDLGTDLLMGKPALTYLRYNVRLEADALEELDLHGLARKAEDLRDMSNADNREELAVIGEKASFVQVKPEHFPAAFDLS